MSLLVPGERGGRGREKEDREEGVREEYSYIWEIKIFHLTFEIYFLHMQSMSRVHQRTAFSW